MEEVPFITKIEKIDILNDKRAYVYIRGLDISSINNTKSDPTFVRRMLLKDLYKMGFKSYIIVSIDDKDVKIQVSNQIYQRLAKQVPALLD